MTWEVKTLGEVCEVLDKKRKPITKKNRVSGEYPYYGASGILDYVDNYIFDERLVLLGEDGAKWGPNEKSAFIAEGKYWVNNHAHVFKPDKNIILDKWIVYYLNYSNLETYTTGVTVPKLNQEKMRSIPIPIPSIGEQKNIVKILDETHEKLKRAKEIFHKNFESSIEIFESELNDIFENPKNNWEEKNLISITSKIGSGATPRGGKNSYKEEGISLIRSMNVHDRKFKFEKIVFIDENQAKKLNNVEVKENDVLLNITGASVARCSEVDVNCLPARVNQHVSIIRLSKNYHPKFLVLALTSKYYKNNLLGIGSKGGSTREAITKKQIEEFKVRFPLLGEQKQIVERLNKLQEKTKKLEKNYQKKLNSIEELKKSILQKAFKEGEL